VILVSNYAVERWDANAVGISWLASASGRECNQFENFWKPYE
jgi:hypothetical protein